MVYAVVGSFTRIPLQENNYGLEVVSENKYVAMSKCNRKFEAAEGNCAGHFYVERGCCLVCGIPEMIAPTLFSESETKGGSCFVRKQPGNPTELGNMIEVLANQEINCIRYAGENEVIQGALLKGGASFGILDWPLVEDE